MNILKRILLILTLFLALIVAISLFLPSNLQVERSILIDADQEQIFNQVNDLKNLKNWSPWALKDIDIYKKESSYSSPSKGKGASFKWDSSHEDLGSGRLTINEIKDQEWIEISTELELLYLKDRWEFKEQEQGVQVIWSTNAEFGFNPIAKFLGLFMEEHLVNDFELGLARLKKFAEELPKIKRVEVKKTSVNRTWMLSLRDSVNATDMNNIHGKMYAHINQFMDVNNIEIGGKPLIIYHYWSDTLIDLEAGIPIQDSIFIEDSMVILNKIDSGSAVTAVHNGAYERLPETYFGINEWMRRNKVVVNGPPWEVYLTDPAEETNPDKWQTAIYFPIK